MAHGLLLMMQKYEQHFHDEFPIYEYIDVTKSDDFDFSILGAKISEIH